MSGSDGTLDETQLAALSLKLGVSPRQLLVAAARLAENADCAHDPAYRARVVADACAGSPDAEAAARLLLTPFADYAMNEIDRLFEGIWPEARRKDE